MPKNIKKIKGFTLLELLVVIAMIGILSSVLIVNLSGTKSNAKLRAAQREVASAIKQAHSWALEGKRFNNATPVKCWGVCIPDDSSYKIIYNDVGNDCNDCSKAAETYSLSGGAKFDALAVNQKISCQPVW